MTLGQLRGRSVGSLDRALCAISYPDLVVAMARMVVSLKLGREEVAFHCLCLRMVMTIGWAVGQLEAAQSLAWA